MTRRIILILVFQLIFSGAGLLAQTSGTLTVTTTTKTYNGQYAPKNIVAVWVEDGSGNFVKTLLAYTQNTQYKKYLSNWKSATSSTYNVVDAITGATKSSHGTRTCTWKGTNTSGTLMADGNYVVKLEMTESNATGKITSVSFSKGSGAVTVSSSDVTGFSSTSVKWVPDVTLSVTESLPDLLADAGSSTTCAITTTTSWTAASSETWLTVSPASGSSNGILTLVASANFTGLARSATVTISAGTLSKKIVVTQLAGGLSRVVLSSQEEPIVYPNPVSGGFFVNGLNQEASIDIINIKGITLATFKVVNLDWIPMTLYPAGLYFVRLQAGEGEKIFRIEKK